MNIASDQLNCYVEGIKVPIKSIKTQTSRNSLSSAEITIPISSLFIDKMWANAFIQVTCVMDINNTRKEKLLFQGLCKSVMTMETESLTQITAESVWGSLNSNTTLYYTTPKKYGLKKLEEGMLLYVGNENVVAPEFESNPGYQLSSRYYYLDVGEDDSEEDVIKQLGFNDPESFKLEFVAQRMPFADRYAKVFFEDIAYDNFLLSKVNIERFNLLTKSKAKSEINTDNISWYEQIGYGFVSGRLFGMTNLFNQYQGSSKDKDLSIPGTPEGTPGDGTAAKDPTNLVDYCANDPRKQYLALCTQKDHLWGDKNTCERLLQFGEKIYNKFNRQVRINDMCCYDSNSHLYFSPTMSKGEKHQTHNDGSSVDIGITGCSNMTEPGYTSQNAFIALDILVNQVGTRSANPSVYFNDSKVNTDKRLNGKVRYCEGHDNHFHAFMVDRQPGK